jgi:DNA modification methylase
MGKDIKLSSGRVLVGDCVARMRDLPDNSIDSIVTDPPYGLEFMGKEWDSFKTGRSAKYAKGGDLDRDAMAERSGKGGAGPSYVNRPAKRCADCGKQAWSGSPCKCDKPRWVLDNSPLHAFQAWFEVVAAEAFRVLKPGGHLLAFGGTRTYHRMACAIEDAGFEIRDSIHWVYGSGFPKSLDVSKAIDKRRDDRKDVLRVTGEIARLRDDAGLKNADLDGLFGFAGMAGHWTSTKSQPTVPTPEQWTVLRERLGPPQWLDDEVWRLNGRKGTPGEAWGQREVTGQHEAPAAGQVWNANYGLPADLTAKERRDIPATPEAAAWEGWGTALKPAHEPVVVARKPLSGTVAGNVLVWGTGALNIDGCRVGTDGGARRGPDDIGDDAATNDVYGKGLGLANAAPRVEGLGRWPANIVLDKAAAAALDQQNEGADRYFTQADFGPNDWPFVYQAKPSKAERNAGLDGLEDKARPVHIQQLEAKHEAEGRGRVADKTTKNNHPTVKPVALMRHLVRLVTPPSGVVLDPFLGSGTTAVAATLEGFRWIGCEMTDDYLPIIRGRVAWAEAEVKAGRADKPQYKTPAPAKPKPAQPTLQEEA